MMKKSNGSFVESIPFFVFGSVGFLVLILLILQYPVIEWPLVGVLTIIFVLGFFLNWLPLKGNQVVLIFQSILLSITMVLVPQLTFFVAFLMAIFLFYLRVKKGLLLATLGIGLFALSHWIWAWVWAEFNFEFFVTHYVLVISLVLILLSADDIKNYLDSQEKENVFLTEILKTFFQVSPLGFLVFDREKSQIKMVNHWIQEYPLLRETSLEDFIFNKLRISSLKEGQPNLLEICHNDQKFFFEVSKFSIQNSIDLVMIIDATDREIERHQQEQQKRLSYLGSMVATIAHEIRNPLTSILGSLDVIMDETHDRETRLKFANLMRHHTSRLNALLSEILDFAKNEKLELQEVDLVKIVTEIWQLMAQDSRFSFLKNLASPYFDGEIIIQADAQKLRQVFLNLLTNACEAACSKPQAEPEVRVQFQVTDKNIVVSVWDNGVGLEKDQIERIFEPFFTTKKKGTGLGLAIVKKILDAHGAKIRVLSQRDVFTQFDIEFQKHHKPI